MSGAPNGTAAALGALAMAAIESFAVEYQLTHMAWILAAIAALPVLYTLQRVIDVLGSVVRVATEGAISSAIAGTALALLTVALRYARASVLPADSALAAHATAALSVLEDYRVLAALAVTVALVRVATATLSFLAPLRGASRAPRKRARRDSSPAAAAAGAAEGNSHAHDE